MTTKLTWDDIEDGFDVCGLCLSSIDHSPNEHIAEVNAYRRRMAARDRALLRHAQLVYDYDRDYDHEFS